MGQLSVFLEVLVSGVNCAIMFLRDKMFKHREEEDLSSQGPADAAHRLEEQEINL